MKQDREHSKRTKEKTGCKKAGQTLKGTALQPGTLFKPAPLPPLAKFIKPTDSITKQIFKDKKSKNLLLKEELSPSFCPAAQSGKGMCNKSGKCPFLRARNRLRGHAITMVKLCDGRLLQITRKESGPAKGKYLLRLFEEVDSLQKTSASLVEKDDLRGQILSSTQEGIIVFDLNLNFKFWNPQMEIISGHAISEVVGRNVFEVFPHLRNSPILDLLNKTLKFNDVNNLIFQYRNSRTRRSIWLSQCNEPLRDSKGKTIGIISTLRDVSAQKQLEEKNAQLASIVESASDAIIGKDLDDVITSFNKGAERIYGYSAAEMLGQSIIRVIPPERRNEIKAIHRAIVAGKSLEPLETVRIHKDGRFINVSLTASPVKNAMGQIIGISTIVRDITEQKSLEAQLRQSQKLEAIGQLASGVAHDFNNLLASIRGNTDLLSLEREKLGAEAIECVDEINFATEKAARLVRKLLAFSSKQAAEIKPLNLNQVIGDLSKMLKRIIGEDIDLQCALAIPLPLVDADASLLEQVILNLAVNARDAMRRGGALKIETQTVLVDAAHVQVHPQARPGEFVCLRATDTGTGIAPEHLPRIFEPFFTTKAPGKGTGLGLATVYGIVNQHQGWIEVASQRGAGTTFSIYLPASTATEPEVSRPIAEAAPGGGTETILLVEDEWSVRRVTGRILEFCGYTVIEASTAQDALKVWDKYNGQFDLLLTDHIMPGGLNGRELVERLRLKKPALKVVFMSGYSAENLKKMADTAEPGLNYFLQKPTPSQTLIATIRRCLDSKAPA